MRDLGQVPRIERPPHLQQEPFRTTRFDEKRVGADTKRPAQIGLLREIGHDDDNRRTNIVPLPHRADESQSIEVSSSEGEIRDDDFRVKGTEQAQCGIWTGHPTSDHAVVPQEGRVHDTALGKSIHNEYPTGPIGPSENHHIVGLSSRRTVVTCL